MQQSLYAVTVTKSDEKDRANINKEDPWYVNAENEEIAKILIQEWTGDVVTGAKRVCPIQEPPR